MAEDGIKSIDELRRSLGKKTSPAKKLIEQEKTPGMDALTGGIVEQIADNVLGVPEAIAKAGVYAGRALRQPRRRGLPKSVLGIEDPIPSSVLNLPTGREAMASIQALPGILSGQYGDYKQQAMAERNQIQQDSPGMFGTGEVVGDAATLAAFRLPKSGTGGLLDDATAALSKKIAGTAAKDAAKHGTAKEVQEWFTSPRVQEFMRGIGRSVETGLEGAALSMVQGEDPVETFGYAAGAQMASSAALSTAKGVFGIPTAVLKKFGVDTPMARMLANITWAGALGTTALQAVGQMGPIAAEEASYDKLTAALLVGAGTIYGKRPKAEGILHNFPNTADFILTIPRSAVIDMAQWASRDDKNKRFIESVKMGEVSEADVKKLNDALPKGNFSKVAEELMNKQDPFKGRFEVVND